MNTHLLTKRIFTALIFLIFFIISSPVVTWISTASNMNICKPILIASANAASQASPNVTPDKWFEGRWTGQIQTKEGAIISVNLIINPLQSGKACASLSYGGKRSCTVQSTYEGTNNNKRIFSLISKNGGSFCDKLDNLTVWQTSTNEISYTVDSGDKKLHEEGRLNR